LSQVVILSYVRSGHVNRSRHDESDVILVGYARETMTVILRPRENRRDRTVREDQG